MRIHKMTDNEMQNCAFTECGKVLHMCGGNASTEWDNVDCLNCLKHFVNDATGEKEKKDE